MKTRMFKRAVDLGLMMDIRDWTFDEGMFEVAIDKGKRFAFQTAAPLG